MERIRVDSFLRNRKEGKGDGRRERSSQRRLEKVSEGVDFERSEPGTQEIGEGRTLGWSGQQRAMGRLSLVKNKGRGKNMKSNLKAETSKHTSGCQSDLPDVVRARIEEKTKK